MLLLLLLMLVFAVGQDQARHDQAHHDSHPHQHHHSTHAMEECEQRCPPSETQAPCMVKCLITFRRHGTTALLTPSKIAHAAAVLQQHSTATLHMRNKKDASLAAIQRKRTPSEPIPPTANLIPGAIQSVQGAAPEARKRTLALKKRK